MTDLYQSLGVESYASTADLKAAYRELAKDLHPDRNGGDKKKTERFKEVSQAYAVLSDPVQRSQYDRMRSSPNRGNVSDFMRNYAQSMPGGIPMPDLTDLNDLFADLFGSMRTGHGGRVGFDTRGGVDDLFGAKTKRGTDFNLDVKVSFSEAALGSKTKVKLFRTSNTSDRELEVTIPPGIKNGTKLRLAGQGGKGPGELPGDLYIHVEVLSDPFLRRSAAGADVEMDLHLTVSEAALGTKIEVPTVDGRMSLAIPACTPSGCRLRLRGRGIKDPHSGVRGDQYCRVEIMIPDDASTNIVKRRLFEELAKAETGTSDSASLPRTSAGSKVSA